MLPNTAPTLAPITNRFVTLGQNVSFAAEASDTDVPPQTFAYSLSGATASAQIGSSSGVFSWAPAVAPATNWLTVVVTDSGTPGLSASQNFQVTVIPPPNLGFSVSCSELVPGCVSVPGQVYQVEYKDSLSDPEWTTAGDTLTGTGGPLTFTYTLDQSPQRYFRLSLLP